MSENNPFAGLPEVPAFSLVSETFVDGQMACGAAITDFWYSGGRGPESSSCVGQCS